MAQDFEQNKVSDKEIERLYQVNLYGRWLVVIISWLTIMPISLWRLREPIALCLEHFTWATIRVALEDFPWASLGVSFCISFLTSVLVWQSTHILKGGLSDRQKYYFAQKIKAIRCQGKKSWLYRWLYR